MVLILSLCRFSRTKVKMEGLATRRLAVGGDGESTEEEHILGEQACKEMEALLLLFSESHGTPPPTPPPSANVPEREQPKKRKRKTDRPADSDSETEQQSKMAKTYSPTPLPDASPGSSVQQQYGWEWDLDEDDVVQGLIQAETGLASWLVDPEVVWEFLDPSATELPQPSPWSETPGPAPPIGKDDNLTLLFEAAKRLQRPQPPSAGVSASDSDAGSFSPHHLSPAPTQQVQELIPLEPLRRTAYGVLHYFVI